MKRLAIILFCLWAFLVVLKGGHKVAIPDAIGFGIADKEYSEEVTETVMVFFDKEFEPLQVIPLAMVAAAIFIPEGGMM